MIARALLFALIVTPLWVAFDYLIGAYGALILAIALTAICIYLFGRYIGPKFPVYLGGDPRPASPMNSDPEWDLYLTIVSGDISSAQRCLARGSNPFARFALGHQPVTTDAETCYEFARQSPGRGAFVELFEQHRVST